MTKQCFRYEHCELDDLPDDIRECILLLKEDIESERPAHIDEIEAAIYQIADYLGAL